MAKTKTNARATKIRRSLESAVIAPKARTSDRNNLELLAKAVASPASEKQFHIVKDEWAPSFSAEQIATFPDPITGEIISFEDWKHGRMSGTSMLLKNGDFEFKIPLAAGIEHKLARHQGSKELDRKSIIGARIWIKGNGQVPSKNFRGKMANLFTIGVAQ